MSKIEKALSRARRENSMALVPTGPRQPSPEQETVTPRAEHGGLVDVESRARASESIARMRRTELRAPDELETNRIIHSGMLESETVRAFRDIRTKILQRTGGRNAVVMVTAVTQHAGSTFVALNLGAAFAFDASKTALLVDCNLSNPTLQGLVGNGPVAGLTDYLENARMDLAEVLQPIGIERMRVIPAGTLHNTPAEYFTSRRIKRLFDEIRHRYLDRFVILDAPSMADSADARILLDLCDYVLLVVPYGAATSAQIDEAMKAINSDKLLGVVFNDEPRLPEIEWRKLPRKSLLFGRQLLSDHIRDFRSKVKKIFTRTGSAK